MGAQCTRELHLSRYKPFFETKKFRFGFLAVIDYTSNHRPLEPFSSSLIPPIRLPLWDEFVLIGAILSHCCLFHAIILRLCLIIEVQSE